MTLTNYWWLLIWIFGAGVVLSIAVPQRSELVEGKMETRWSIPAAIALVVPYIIWAGFRGDNFGDTGSYRTMFLEAPSAVSEWGVYLTGITKDKGFSVLTLVIKLIVNNSDILFFFIIAAFQILCVALIYRKYSCNYWLSIFVFIASTDYISWVHNGMRQFTAVALIFAATGLLLKKKYIPMVFVILLASTIHLSALLMIPVIFIIQGKAWNKRTVLCVVASVLALIFVNQFTDILEKLLSDTQYTNVVSDWQAWEDDGTNPIRVLVYSIPTILSLVGYRYIKKEDDPVINMAINAGIVSTAIYIISMGTSGIFIGRLPIFVSLMNGIVLPWELKYMFKKDSERFIMIAVVGFYILFFYYQMHFTWGLV